MLVKFVLLTTLGQLPLCGKAAMAYCSYTSPPARVCAGKPAHGNDAAIFACFLFCTAPLPRKAQHKSDIKIFYHYQEGFSTNFHIFIHKNHARPISLRQQLRLFANSNQKGSLDTDKRPDKAPFAGIVCRDSAGNKRFCKQSVLHQWYFWMVGTRRFILIGFATWSFIPASSAACLSSEKAFAVIAMMGTPAFWGSSILLIFFAAS